MGVEVSGYTDDTAVDVLSPAVNAAVVSPTSGWNVGGSYLVDVVSAASPDIVSMASPAFKETRHAGSLSGGVKIENVGVNGFGNVSREPDYLSVTGGASTSIELADKLTTPRFGYSLHYDTIGIRDTTFENFKRKFANHTIDGGVTFVLSPTTLVVTGLSLQIERGEYVDFQLLLKPLGDEGRGVSHKGGPVLRASPNDPGWNCFHGWIAGAHDPAACAAATF